MNLNLKNIQNTLNTYKHKKLVVSAAVFIVLIFIFFFYLGIQTPETTPDNPKPRSFPQRISQGFQDLKSSIGLGKETTRSPIPEPELPSTIDTIDKRQAIATEIANYVQNQKLSDGFYEYLAHYDEQCETKGGKISCPFDGQRMFETTNAWTALGYLAYFKISDNPTYLQLAKNDIDTLINSSCNNNLTNCLWILTQIIKLSDALNEKDQYNNFLKSAGDELLKNSHSEDLMLLSIESRTLTLLYAKFSDSRYLIEADTRLRLAQRLFNKTHSLYTNDDSTPFPATVCWQMLGAVELSRYPGYEHYLSETEDFINRAKIRDHFSSFSHPVEIQPCIETYFELYKKTGKIEYYNQGMNLLNLFLSSFWDSESNGKTYNEGGTLYSLDSRRIVLTDSIYTLYLLSLTGK